MTKTFIFLMTTSLVLLAVNPSAHAHSVPNAKAAELALHRLERLVVLKKVEDGYQSRFSAMSVTPIAHQTGTVPAFEAILRQPAASDGSFKSLKIVMNEDGKALEHVIGVGNDAANPIAWTDKDPVTLSENALHYVLDNSDTETQLKPYLEGLTELSISAGNDAAGAPAAIIAIKAAADAPTLKITVKLDGTFESYQITH